MSFALHPALAADCLELGALSLSRALLMDNRLFPWLILVPQREGVTELFDLAKQDSLTLSEEIRRVAKALADHTGAHKINIAALGNQVPQLHVHIIARFRDDPAWPNPVWSAALPAEPYSDGSTPDAYRALIANITKM